jgi:hypothetical protein
LAPILGKLQHARQRFGYCATVLDVLIPAMAA